MSSTPDNQQKQIQIPINERSNYVLPFNYGWVETKLTQEAIDHLWKCIDNKQEDHRDQLVGQVSHSFALKDTGNKFLTDTLNPLIKDYNENNGHWQRPPITNPCTVYLKDMWVNYQYKHEFNPPHNHAGVYSFVIWMKIPTTSKEQNELPNAKGSNGPQNSAFYITYSDIFGQFHTHLKQMNPDCEGTMLFFPSALVHGVNPFYNCDEPRISISGNLFLDPEIEYDSTPPQVVPVAKSPMKTL
tara:strand:+ start:60 stop:788 length:729 start_codon:yes stop_codon:yes gene_type:complete